MSSTRDLQACYNKLDHQINRNFVPVCIVYNSGFQKITENNTVVAMMIYLLQRFTIQIGIILPGAILIYFDTVSLEVLRHFEIASFFSSISKVLCTLQAWVFH